MTIDESFDRYLWHLETLQLVVLWALIAALVISIGACVFLFVTGMFRRFWRR